MYIESFPSKLKKARIDAGYTQEQVHDILNINRSTLANYEIGRTEPKIETLGLLADFYEVSTDWLIGTKGGKKQ
ncbi:helix-turn-helix domain-containing protein [Faecalibacillus faecis]|jgi:transcriptional regulator with XRE-family HTH domain|uniref:helix-turn-helix domain-containing protein n=1 Tax=Faecalibacillus faecis TaxID=1982628 RepID=UPI003FD8CD83